MKREAGGAILGAVLALIGIGQAARSAEPRSQDRQAPAAFTVPALWEYSAIREAYRDQ